MKNKKEKKKKKKKKRKKNQPTPLTDYQYSTIKQLTFNKEIQRHATLLIPARQQTPASSAQSGTGAGGVQQTCSAFLQTHHVQAARFQIPLILLARTFVANLVIALTAKALDALGAFVISLCSSFINLNLFSLC